MPGFDFNMYLPTKLTVLLSGVEDGGLEKELHMQSSGLARDLVARVQQRMRERFISGYSTGAAEEDVSFRYNTDTRQARVVTLYSGTENQLAQWNRVYIAYQEGPPMGKETYTAGMRHVYYDTQTEDMPLLDEWAWEVAEKYTGTWGQVT